MTSLVHLKQYLVQADRDLTESSARIARQQRHLEDRQQAALNLEAGSKLLVVMQATHESMQNHRCVLVQAIEAHERAPEIR